MSQIPRKNGCEKQSVSPLYTPMPKELEGRYGQVHAFADDGPIDGNLAQKAKRRPVPFSVAHYLLSAHGAKITLRDFIWIRKAAGRKIDPETAEVDRIEFAVGVCDPHNMHAKGYWQVGRVYFARSPGSDIWVRFAGIAQRDPR
jgi:hypothetical protein